ncbi:hypothetical protein ACROYT_G002052 [Oculina patagonica]
MISLERLVANIFTVSVLLALSFGSIGHVGARPQGTLVSFSSSGTAQGSVTCETIQTEIYAQTPFNVTFDNCTESARTVTACNIPFIFHVCKSGCEQMKTVFDISDCNPHFACVYTTGCKETNEATGNWHG